MKRRLFNLAAALSLVFTIAAVVGWAMSHARPGWHLIGTAHSDDLTQMSSETGTALFTATPNWSKASNHGYWDALWARSDSGKLTLLAQAMDYEGALRRVYAAPPSVIVDPPGPSARSRTVTLPWWILLLLGLPAPLLWLRRARSVPVAAQ